MDGNTEERLSIVATLLGDRRVQSGLAAMAREAREASRDRTATIRYRDDGSIAGVTRKAKQAEGAMSSLAKAAQGGGKAVTGAFMGLVAVPGIFSLIAIALGGLPGLLSAATGAVVALGVGFTALGAIMGTVLIGMNGIVDAVSQGRTAQDQAKQEAERYAAALQALESANRGVTNAQKAAVAAQRDLAQAQKDFNNAPKEAADQLADAHLKAADAALSEREAVLRLQQAQQNLSELQKNVGKSTLSIIQQTDSFTGKIVESVTKSSKAITQNDIANASLSVERAQLALLEARKNNTDAQADLNDKVAKGIEGSDIYQKALLNLTEAQDRVASSQQDIIDAQKNLNRAQKDAVPQATAYEKALSKLTPEAREFVTFVNGKLIPAFTSIRDAVQRNMLPGVQSGLQVLVDNTDGLSDGFGRLGKAVGDSFNEFMQYWGKPENKSILSNLVDGLAGPDGAISTLSRALGPLSSILAQVITAATPLFNTLMTEFGDWLDSIDKSLKAGGASDLQNWFSGLAGPITDTFGLLGDLASALTPLTGENGTFHQLIQSLRTDFIPSFREFIDALSKSNLADGFVTVLTAVTNVVTWLVKLNEATNNGLLYGILAILASAQFLSGVAGFASMLSALGLVGGGGLLGALGGGAGAGAAAGGGGAGGAAAGAAGLGGGAIAGIAAAIVTAITAVVQGGTSFNTFLGRVNSGQATMQNAPGGGKTWDTETARSGGSALVFLAAPITGLIQTALDAFFPELGKNFRSLIGDIGQQWSDSITLFVTRDIPNLAAGIANIGIAMNKVVDSTFGEAARGIQSFIGGAILGFARIATGLWNGFWDVVHGVGQMFGGVVELFKGNWTGFMDGVSRGWTTVTDGVRTAFEGVTNGIRTVIDGIWNGIKGLINGAIGIVNLIPGINIPKLAADGGTVGGNGDRAGRGTTGLRKAAYGATVPGGGAYRDKVPYLLAPGEEVISNRNGQADRHRSLLKSINNGSYDNNPSAVDIEALVEKIIEAAKPNVVVEAKMGSDVTPAEIGQELAWKLR